MLTVSLVTEMSEDLTVFLHNEVLDTLPRNICVSCQYDLAENSVGGLKSRFLHPDVQDYFYITQSGKPVCEDDPLVNNTQYALHLRVLGGKGGFGSLLRSFGSQISKNRNQDACRDLSGRRLRNVKAEQKVKEIVEKQAEKEKDKKRKKEEKIQKLKSALTDKPKHTFHDPNYEAERSRIPDMVFSAVEEGNKTIASTSAVVASTSAGDTHMQSTVIVEEHHPLPSVPVDKKRKHVDPLEKNMGSKKMKGWLGVDDESSDEE
ncbi:splicing regulator SDE2-like [Paramacrobiotus metropolitanus]|uniref:splicing regulator SDE2-like n=1 Tax=Paramacrobiotus metropolitanus TaxID=2943436 RepID=UPI0024455F3B|nr:splicing regulator SDE2-like [Paramacrobiotus metropolitanus]